MRRTIKIVLVVLGILLALLVAVAVALPFLVDPNDYRDQIEAAVEERTGREFTLEGDLELSVFPWLGVEMGPARLANAPGFGEEPFAEIEGAQVSVRVLPLLRRRIEVGTVGLDGLRLRLVSRADGNNWQDLAAADEAAPPEPEPEVEEDGWTLPDLEIGAVEVDDAAVSYRDAAAGRTYAVHNANLTTGRLAVGRSFPINLGFEFEIEEMDLAGQANLVAQLRPDLQNRFYRLSEMSLTVRARGDAVPGGEQQVLLTGNAELDMQAGRLSVADLVLQGLGIKASGSVDGSDIASRPTFSGRFSVEPFDPRAVMETLGMEPPATSDPGVLATAELDTRFQADPDDIQLKQLKLRLDDSTLEGEAGVDLSGGGPPAISFALALDRMNLDRYMPPESEDEQDEEEAEPDTAEIPLELLRDLRLDGRVTAGSLTAAGLNVEDAELTVTARDGVLTIRPLSANLYGGSLRLDGTVDASGKRPRYAVNGNLQSLQLGPLLTDLIGQERVTALANLQLDLAASGDTVEDIRRALDGNVAFELRDGAIHGFDLSSILAAARSRLLDGASADGGAAGGEMPFSRFSASFDVDDGVFRGNDLALVTPKARLTGRGSFDLVANELDYTVTAHIPEDARGDVLEELAGYSIPIRLSGNLFSPGYSVDLRSALEGRARERIREEEAEVREKIDERVQEEREELRERFQKGLQDLFD